jgi:hypothetical protein
MRAVTTDHLVERLAQTERGENALAWNRWFVRQNSEAGMDARLSHDIGDAVVHACVIQQPIVVNREKPFERVRSFAPTGSAHRASDEQRRTLTHHPADFFFSESLATELLDQLIGRVRQIAPRIDEGAVEVERYQAV